MMVDLVQDHKLKKKKMSVVMEKPKKLSPIPKKVSAQVLNKKTAKIKQECEVLKKRLAKVSDPAYPNSVRAETQEVLGKIKVAKQEEKDLYQQRYKHNAKLNALIERDLIQEGQSLGLKNSHGRYLQLKVELLKYKDKRIMETTYFLKQRLDGLKAKIDAYDQKALKAGLDFGNPNIATEPDAFIQDKINEGKVEPSLQLVNYAPAKIYTRKMLAQRDKSMGEHKGEKVRFKDIQSNDFYSFYVEKTRKNLNAREGLKA